MENNKNLQEMILLLLHGAGDMTEDQIKHMLFKSDFAAYRETGKSISNTTYTKGQITPDHVGFKQAINTLFAEGRIHSVEETTKKWTIPSEA